MVGHLLQIDTGTLVVQRSPAGMPEEEKALLLLQQGRLRNQNETKRGNAAAGRGGHTTVDGRLVATNEQRTKKKERHPKTVSASVDLWSNQHD